jgi:hypothetical protein
VYRTQGTARFPVCGKMEGAVFGNFHQL